MTQTKENYQLIGMRINAESDQSEFYTLFVGGIDRSPLLIESLPVWLSASRLSELSAIFHVDNLPDLKELERDAFHIDFPEALYLLGSEQEDPNIEILSLLNILSDYFEGINMVLPRIYSDALNEFVRFITFTKSFGEFFNESNIPKSTLSNGIIWCLGAIMAYSKFYF